jgi:1,2-diacylglycerol-3-alpha-glucose alpha-1,2-glucosyltransferase
MKINLVSDTTYMMPICGPHTVLINTAKYLRKMGHEVDINGNAKNYDVVHIHSVGALGLKWILQNKVPKVISAHVTPYDVIGDIIFDKYLARAIKPYLKLCYNSADEIITPTHFTAGLLEKMGIKKDVTVVSNGVDLEVFKRDENRAKRFRKTYDLAMDRKIVYAVGAPGPRKGIYTFMKIAEKFPDVYFVWVGQPRLGPLQKDSHKIKIRAKTAPKNVILTGFVEDVVGAHSAGDIFMFPTYYENQGIVTLEAAACGNPIVTRNIPLYSDGWLKHRKNAMIVSEDHEFEACIRELLNNPDLLKKGTIALAKEHSMQKVVKQVLEVYRKAIISHKKDVTAKLSWNHRLYRFLTKKNIYAPFFLK